MRQTDGGMMDLPGCNELFQRFCAPRYDAAAQERHGLECTKGDMETRWKLGTPVERVHITADEDRGAILRQLDRMLDSAKGDWKIILPIEGVPSVQWIEAFDRYYDRPAIQRVIDRSNSSDNANDYHIICVQLAVVLGTVLCQLLPRLAWLPDWPYWESAPYDADTGTRVCVFSWAVKKMSGYGVDDGLAEKVRVTALMLRQHSRSIS